MNVLLILVCFKLHNYYIWMANVIYNSPTSDPTECGIEPYINGTNNAYEFGFLPTNCHDDATFLFPLIATLTQLVATLLLQTLCQGPYKTPCII